MFENFTAVIMKDEELGNLTVEGTALIIKHAQKPDNLSFEGTALMEHRGNYTCQVDLKENLKESHLYPVHFSYFVRIKGYAVTF